MALTFVCWFLIASIVIGLNAKETSTWSSMKEPRRTAKVNCTPLIVAHRGASGYVPEHTIGAFALSITMGADYVEPDLVMTSDGYLIARHDNELGLSTDVAQRPEFANRYRTQMIDGREFRGWFSEDFTITELKTLRAIERIPANRPGNARMDLAFDVPTLQEIIDLVKGMELSERRTIGLYPEIKHPTHFQRIGLAMERPLVEILNSNGYYGPEAPVYIQSFEVSNLKELRNLTDLPLVQLFGNPANRPFDQVEIGSSLTYGVMATAEGLLDIAKYANGVGPEKGYIITRTSDNKLGEATSFVANAHAAGLEVHPYTFRAENTFLPVEFRSDNTAVDAIGDLEGEIRVFLETGIDGFFVDQPDVPVQIRGQCNNNNKALIHQLHSYLQLVTLLYLLIYIFLNVYTC